MTPTTNDYVDLDREFIVIDPKVDDLDQLRELASYGGIYAGTVAWDSLWQSQAVVILAEAGAGKTTELEAQADKLVKAGKSAFFITIEELADGDLDKALQVGDEARFYDWLESQESGYFLLDSVDETRLVNKSFEKAIKTLVRRVGTAITRCKLVITCRFYDWRWHIDQSAIMDKLPKAPSPIPDEYMAEPTDDGLLKPIFAKNEADDPFATNDDNDKPAPAYRLVTLAPLGQRQWRLFAQARNESAIESFVQAIHECDAEDSASRPLDLDRLIKYWQRFDELGTLTERLQYDAEQRLAEVNPRYQAKHELSLARGYQGAETLAAALTLCAFRSIRLPAASTDSQVRDDSLDSRTVLDDWPDPEIGALLHRAMFHGTSYGCAGFHHRNMQPYFAAKFLYRLSQQSMSYRRLRALLIADMNGRSILRPSMASVAAWLAAWEPRVHQWLLDTSPETLMAHGDPESLSDQQCGEVLTTFCDKYVGRTDTGLRLAREQALRLARPSLGPVIRRLWQQHAQYDDQRWLLLRMIEHGPISAAADLATDAALNEQYPIMTREYALQAVAAAASDSDKRRLIGVLVEDAARLDPRCAGALIRLFYPDFLRIEELHRLVTLTTEAVKGVWRYDLKSAIKEVAKSLDAKAAQNFIHEWALLLQTSPHVKPIRLPLSEQYLWLVPPVAVLCQTLLTNATKPPDPTTATVTELVCRAKQYQILHYTDDLPNLTETVSRNAVLNEFFFWRSVRRKAEELGKPVTDWWAVQKFGDTWTLGAGDVEWLTNTIRDASHDSDRHVALSALVFLRSCWESDAATKDRVLSAATAAGLLDSLEESIHQANRPTKLSKMDEKYRRKSLARDERDKRSWLEFRERHIQQPELLADPNRADTDEGFSDRYWFVRWLEERVPVNDSWGVKDWRSLREGFPESVVIAARDALIHYWPLYVPPLEPEKETPNLHYSQLNIGMSGLNFLAEQDPHWCSSLNSTDAETAIRYALEERSGLPFWAPQLFDAHEPLVNDIVQRQIQWDFEQPEVEHYQFSVLDTFRFGDQTTSDRFMPLLLEQLRDKDPASVTALRFSIERLMHAPLEMIEPMADLAYANTENAWLKDDTERACLWLSVLLCFAPERGIRRLNAWLDACDEDGRDALFISAMSALFGHDGPHYPSDRMACLSLPFVGELVGLGYAHAPVEGDRIPEGMYSPNSRDAAKRARGYFLERVLEAPGESSVRILEELAAAASDDVSRDRFLVLADQRRAKNVELEALSTQAFVQLRRRGELQPGNAEEFFRLVLDKAHDVRLYLEGDDDQLKSLIRDELDEHAVQLKLKTEFDRLANGLYNTYRETEVAEGNAPDFIISSTSVLAEVAIEVKVADNNYTITKFISIIHDQLIGKYLRMSGSRDHGVLVITYHGKKQYWVHPETRKRVDFRQLVKLLEIESATAVAQREDVRGLSVVGIDLTDLKNRKR
ncbi:MAG: hypothetical protein IIA11_03415 [Proteobacteria bacterium]|nr:hypothetical protein [Pseudomonadota bacterium]